MLGPQGLSGATIPWSCPSCSYTHPSSLPQPVTSFFPWAGVMSRPMYLPLSTLPPNGTSPHAATTDSIIRLIGDPPGNKPVLTQD